MGLHPKPPYHQLDASTGAKMNSIIYIVGLVVIVGAILAFFGLR